MDPLLMAAQLTLGALGVLGVATSSPDNWPEHLSRVLIALLVTLLVSRVSPLRIVKLSPAIYVSVLGLLVLVLFRGVSPAGSDANRWLDLGVFVLQPSELMKVAVIAYLTAFFHNHLGRWQIWRPMLVVSLAVTLIGAEPNISTALFVFLLGLAIMVAAGSTLRRLIGISFAVMVFFSLTAAPLLLWQYPYIGERITTFIAGRGNPEMAQDEAYQAEQAARYLRAGGLIGLGVGESTNLPAKDTDMIAVSIGHALGLVGTLTLFAVYGVIALRGVQIASSLTGPGALLAVGATTYICGQAALNLLVASGLLPITGVPLPFVSWGFNSLLSVGIAMGFIQSAYRSTKARAPEAPALKRIEA